MQREARFFEVWAARAWNVFNEGKPFGIVYPPMALAGAALLGLDPGGALGYGLLAGLGLALLPPAHGRAVDELHALLAARRHELRPDERQRARAGAKARARAERHR